MSVFQLFINKLKSKCNENISFIDEVSSVLDINYDAAYRRVTNKTKINFEEAVKLSAYFNVPLNQFVDNSQEGYFLVKKTKEIKSILDLENYFKTLNNSLKQFQNKKTSSIFYSAKDLPIFYLLNNQELLRFKIYAWLYILEPTTVNKSSTFEDFKIPLNLEREATITGEMYKNITITEIWSYGVLDSVINQINYFYDLKLINFHTAKKICENLRKIIEEIELASQNGYKNNKFKTPYNLYSNELLLLNNNIYFKTHFNKALFSPYSLLSFYLTEDQEVCLEYEKLLKEQLLHSKLLSRIGLKDRILFFKPKYQKINELERKLEFYKDFSVNNL